MLSDRPFECPPALLEKANETPPTVMAVAGADSRVALESARRATEAALITPCLIGDQDAIAARAREIGWDISGLRIEAAEDGHKAAERAVALARGGEVEAIMKGHVHTSELMRAVVNRESGLRTERRISHVFHMSLPGRAGSLSITDAAVNVAPDIPTQLDLLRNALDLQHALGNTAPKVAVLSATEKPIDAMPSSHQAKEVVERARDEIDGVVIDGPLALDVAVSPEAVAIKGIDSPVAGEADLLLVPNIETGNALFKSMVCYMSATAAGLVLGARVPIVLTSRADPPEARLAATALAAIVAAAEARAT